MIIKESCMVVRPGRDMVYVFKPGKPRYRFGREFSWRAGGRYNGYEFYICDMSYYGCKENHCHTCNAGDYGADRRECNCWYCERDKYYNDNSVRQSYYGGQYSNKGNRFSVGQKGKIDPDFIHCSGRKRDFPEIKVKV